MAYFSKLVKGNFLLFSLAKAWKKKTSSTPTARLFGYFSRKGRKGAKNAEKEEKRRGGELMF